MTSTGSYIYAAICFFVALMVVVIFPGITLFGLILGCGPWIFAGCLSLSTAEKLRKMNK